MERTQATQDPEEQEAPRSKVILQKYLGVVLLSLKPNYLAVVGTFFTNRFPSLRIFVDKKVGNQKN